MAEAHGFLELQPEADPQSVQAALDAAERPRRVQVSQPLPGHLLDALAEALRSHPDVGLRFYGFYAGLPDDLSPTLGWIERFAFIRSLAIELRDATSFGVLSSFTNLEQLSLGQTKSTRPSLSFLRLLPNLQTLWIEAHDRDFNVIAETKALQQLWLRTPRVRTLNALRGHGRIELLDIDFGGIRDLSPLSEIPRLQAVGLYQVRRLDTNDFSAIGECGSLVAMSLGALRNISDLAALAEGPKHTLRFLTMEHMLGLETLSDLGDCQALEQLYLDECKPRDGRLDLVARAPNLRHLIVADAYTKEQQAAADRVFQGQTLSVRTNELRGQRFDPDMITRWRTPVSELLKHAKAYANE